MCFCSIHKNTSEWDGRSWIRCIWSDGSVVPFETVLPASCIPEGTVSLLFFFLSLNDTFCEFYEIWQTKPMQTVDDNSFRKYPILTKISGHCATVGTFFGTNLNRKYPGVKFWRDSRQHHCMPAYWMNICVNSFFLTFAQCLPIQQ